MLKVKELIIYPVKGLAGIHLDQCYAQTEGFTLDRRWLIVDDKNGFVSQRQVPEMALIKTVLEKDRLVLSYKDSSIFMPLDRATSTDIFPVSIWTHTVDAFEWSRDVSRWLSDIMKMDVRIVARAPDAVRLKEIPSIDRSVPLSFADGYPYLILGTESVDHLNGKLDNAISHDRFRPNLYIETTQAHTEDDWEEIKIGEAHLQIVKPCVRCQVLGINQSTAQKSREPIATLNRYRKIDNGIIFGANTICNIEGIVRVGDQVELI